MLMLVSKRSECRNPCGYDEIHVPMLIVLSRMCEASNRAISHFSFHCMDVLEPNDAFLAATRASFDKPASFSASAPKKGAFIFVEW